MSMSNTLETGLLNLIFTNADFTLLGDAGGIRGSVAAGSIYAGLHSADPGEAGDQTTSEIVYTSYARVAVARTGGAWSVSGNQVQNIAAITFPAGTGGSGTATHGSLGTSVSAAGKLLFKGALTPNLPVGNGITPQINANGLTITMD